MRQPKEKGIEQILIAGDVGQQVLGLVRSPAWKHVQHYLRTKRRIEARKLIYVYKASSNADEIAASQARIRLIDELLADTQESSLKLASDVADQLGEPGGAPFNAD